MQLTEQHDTSVPTVTNTPAPSWMIWTRVLLVVATIGAAYLAAVAFYNGPVAGCGPGSGCDKVLSSHWAYWLDVPVSVPAVFTYLALLVVTFLIQRRRLPEQRRAAWVLAIGLSVLIAGAAVWFVGLQMFVIEAFCKFCLVAHACGFSAALMCLRNVPYAADPQMAAWAASPNESGVPRKAFMPVAAMGIAGALLLAGGQVLLPKQRNVVKDFRTAAKGGGAAPKAASGTTNAVSAAPAVAVPNSPNAQLIGPKLLSLYNGQFVFQLDEVPMIGPSDAPNIIVSLFDYNCNHCRLLHPILGEVQRRFGNRLGIVNLPMPMDRACNPYVPPKHPTFTNSCDYARISLAVWQTDRAAYGRFDDWLFSTQQPAPVDQVRDYAARLIGAEKLASAMTNGWIDQQILKACNLHYTNWQATAGPAMPQIIIGPVISVGALNSRNDLLVLLEKYLGLKP